MKEVSKSIIKFANLIFVLGILYFSTLLIYLIFKIYLTPEIILQKTYLFIVLINIIFLLLFIFGLKFNNHLKVNLSLLFIVVGFTVYIFEIFLNYYQPKNMRAEQVAIKIDKRTKIEVIQDLKNSGIDAYPNIHPGYLLKDSSTRNGLIINNNESKIFPLGGISNKLMVQHNENGNWMKYVGDEHGFHNPKGLYNNQKLDIAIIGDSFAEGWSVNSDENISAILRNLNYSVINFGKSGNGPLLEFATLKEYVKPLKPKIVLWLYFVNDFSDLNSELESSFLKKYFNEEFSQNLMFRQDEIDKTLLNFVNQEWNKLEKQKITKERKIKLYDSLKNIIKIHNLRIKIKSFLTSKPNKDYSYFKNNPSEVRIIRGPVIEEDLLVFKNILKKSDSIINQWGGKLYFVYLPPYEIYKGYEPIYRKKILQIVKENEIEIIDIHKEVFSIHEDPLSLFPFRLDGHYNAKGYNLIAETISTKIAY